MPIRATTCQRSSSRRCSAKFNINPTFTAETTALRWSAPDFENRTDTDHDNRYEVTVQVSERQRRHRHAGDHGDGRRMSAGVTITGPPATIGSMAATPSAGSRRQRTTTTSFTASVATTCSSVSAATTRSPAMPATTSCRAARGQDILDGGNGDDTAVLQRQVGRGNRSRLNGAGNAIVTVGGVAEDTIRNIENMNGGTGADTLTGDGHDNYLPGGAVARTFSMAATASTRPTIATRPCAVVVTLNGALDADRDGRRRRRRHDPQHRERLWRVGGRHVDGRRQCQCVSSAWAGRRRSLWRRWRRPLASAGPAATRSTEVLERTSPTTATRPTAVVVVLTGGATAVVTVGGTAEDTIRNIEEVYGGSAARPAHRR